jgi:6-phosphogluconolactonase/glucosamine-6-phosphate isomerase/deaminase
MNINRSGDPEHEAGKALGALLLLHADSPILLLVSGGSALGLLAHVSKDVLGSHITLGVLDERCTDDMSSRNYTQLAVTEFFARALLRGVHSLPILDEAHNTDVDAEFRFEQRLRHWKEENPAGQIVVTMGIGVDGHTAGIFPDVPDVTFDSLDWVVSYHLPENINPFTHRITVTYTFLLSVVDAVIVLAKGEDKTAIVERIINKSVSLDTTPAAILNELPSVSLFTDQFR